MKTLHHMFRPARVSGCLVVVALLAAPAMSQAHVHPRGSFFPTGSPSAPFQRIDAAAAAVIAAGSTAALQLESGTLFPDTGVLDTPPGTTMTLTTDGIGDARIGYTVNHKDVTLSIYSMNAHLFGVGSAQGSLCPCFPTVGEVGPTGPGIPPVAYTLERAFAIASYMDQQLTDYDVICMQEVWDENQRDYIYNLLGGANSPWPYSAYGGFVEDYGPNLFPLPPFLPGCLNSGLWILSKYPITNAVQGVFNDETPLLLGGEEASTKGWLECTVQLNDGQYSVPVQIFTTHTEAEDTGVRFSQILQLFNRTEAFKNAFPDIPMFVCGDFNIAQTSTDCVASDCTEYYTNFKGLFGNLFNDAHPNVGSWYEIPDSEKYTNTQANDLAQHFDPGDESSRLDYILYRRHALQDDDFAIIPNWSFVDFWQGAPSWSGTAGDKGTCDDAPYPSTTNLSDHQGIAAEFTIYF